MFNRITLENIVLSLGVSLSLIFGSLTAINYIKHHKVSYDLGDCTIYQKADGVLDYTELEVWDNGSVVVNWYLLFDIPEQNMDKGTKRYHRNVMHADIDGDGKVDTIYQSYFILPYLGSSERQFFRDEHLEQYPELFEEADKEFNKQLERFGYERE